MIVICPSCGTPYRHAVEAGPPLRNARCSRCSCTFPMPAGRSYRVESVGADEEPSVPGVQQVVHVGTASPPPASRVEGPVVGAARGLTIGMDDPTLAPSLERSALTQEAGTPRAAITYWVVADEPARSGAPPAAAEEEEEEEKNEASAPPVDAEDSAVPHRAREKARHAPPAADTAVPGEDRRRAPRVPVALAGGGGVGIVWGAAIAAVAGEPLWQGAALGGALGLALAGGVLRWNARRH